MTSTFESTIIKSHIRDLFISAGWRPSGDQDWNLSTVSSGELARYVAKEFGALRVGTSGPGTEQASSDVHFYDDVEPGDEEFVKPWSNNVGPLQSIATAHRDHMVIFLGLDGSVFAFTDPDDQLYRIGANFAEGMMRLLLGFRFGPSIPRDV